MFKKALVFAVTAACLTAGAAQAQSYDHRHGHRAQQSDRNGYHGYNGYANEGDRYRRGDRNDYSSRNDYRRDRHDGYRSDRYDSRDYRERNDGWRNGGYERSQRHYLRRGERLSHHHGRHYVVSDWRRHRGLYAPHRGHQWVQVNGEFALVAIATGIIAHVLLN